MAPIKQMVLSKTTDALSSAIGRIAAVLTESSPPELVAQVFDAVKSWEANLEDIKNLAKKRLTALLIAEGEVVTDKGSRRLERGGWLLECRPSRTGFDARRIEGLLRAKQLQVENFMDSTISYKVNESRLEAAVNSGKLTAAELESCKYEMTYTLQPPRKVSRDE